MIKITLINGYFIEHDKRNYTLKQKYQGKAKESVKTISHHQDLEGAVRSFLNINQVDEMSKLSLDLMQYVKMVDEVNRNAVLAIMSVLEW